VFKEVGEYRTLRELGRAHMMIVQDVVRVQNRIKALFRSRGVTVSGKSIYSESGREAFLAKLPDASRGAARTLCAQYDAAFAIRREAEKASRVGRFPPRVRGRLRVCGGRVDGGRFLRLRGRGGRETGRCAPFGRAQPGQSPRAM